MYRHIKAHYTIGLKKIAPLFHPIRSKTKTNLNWLAHVFPRFAPLHGFTSSFDWFTGTSVPFVIGWSLYFGLALTTEENCML